MLRRINPFIRSAHGGTRLLDAGRNPAGVLADDCMGDLVRVANTSPIPRSERWSGKPGVPFRNAARMSDKGYAHSSQ